MEDCLDSGIGSFDKSNGSHGYSPFLHFYQLSPQRFLPEMRSKTLNLLGSQNLFGEGVRKISSWSCHFSPLQQAAARPEDNPICACLLCYHYVFSPGLCRPLECKAGSGLRWARGVLGHGEQSDRWPCHFHWLLDDLELVSQPLLPFLFHFLIETLFSLSHTKMWKFIAIKKR